MFNKIIQLKKYLSLIITIIFMIGMGYAVYSFVSSEMERVEAVESMTEPLKLKADKEKILSSQVIENTGIENSEEAENQDTDDIVKYYYVSDTEVPTAIYQGIEEDISKRTNNAQFFKQGETEDEEKWVAMFYSGAPFYQDGDNWMHVESATTTKQAFFQQTRLSLGEKIKNLFRKEALAHDYHASSGDGYVKHSNANWETAHDAVTGTTAYDSPIIVETTEAIIVTSYIYNRAFLTFDTSSLQDMIEITGATVYVYPFQILAQDNDGEDWINVVQTTQDSPTTLITADYDTCGAVTNPTEGSTRKDLSSDFVLGYNGFILNSTGLAWINTTGYTQIGFREGHDALGTQIASNSTNRMWIYSSEQTGTSQDPYMTVTFIAPSSYKMKGTIKMKGTVKF